MMHTTLSSSRTLHVLSLDSNLHLTMLGPSASAVSGDASDMSVHVQRKHFCAQRQWILIPWVGTAADASLDLASRSFDSTTVQGVSGTSTIIYASQSTFYTAHRDQYIYVNSAGEADK